MSKTTLPHSTRRYRAAAYARLSVDDNTLGTNNSIINQLALIKDFAEGRDDIDIVGEYSDDGYSGSNFVDRLEWNRLIGDIEEGRVDCIVVKDLSRLGRDHLGVQRYFDQIFPAIGVRFIAINDDYDSSALRTNADGLMLPIKNLFNSIYCRDASLKTKASLAAKRKRGEFVGSFAPYGYEKGKGEDRGKLVIDPEPAGIQWCSLMVKGLFRWSFLEILEQSQFPQVLRCVRTVLLLFLMEVSVYRMGRPLNQMERYDGAILSAGPGTTVLVDGTVNDPSVSGPSDGSGDSGNSPGGSADDEKSNLPDNQEGFGEDSGDSLPKTNDVIGVAFGAFATYAVAAVIMGFVALRKVCR